MKLPNHEEAIIPEPKIVGYLLSESHRDGRSKAAFFKRLGFSAAQWHTLADALRRHASEHEVTNREDSPFGTRYVIEGIMPTPDGRAPMIRSVWFLDTDAEIPRFATAYPIKREGI